MESLLPQLLGPLGLVVALLIIVVVAVRKDPLWYTPSQYRAMVAERDRERTERERERQETQATIRKWEERVDRSLNVAQQSAAVSAKATRADLEVKE